MKRIVLTAACFAQLATAIASCTTFDGLEAQAPAGDASVVDSPVPPPPLDANGDMEAGEAGPVQTTYLDPSDAARACANVFKCSLLAGSIVASIAVPVDPTNFSSCMDWLSGPLPPNRVGVNIQSGMFQCIANATSCQAAGSCVPIEDLAPNDPRCGDAGTDAAEKCADDGGTVLRCRDQYALHCDTAYYAPGSRCLKGSDNSHWCAINTNCATASQCVGSLNDYCGSPSNLHEGVNCAAEGFTCGLEPDASDPTCLTSTTVETCAAVGSDCAGHSVVVCDGFQLSKFDCSALGGTCSKTGGPAHCVRTADRCTSFGAAANVCVGTSIALCVGGSMTTFDCASIGLTCKPAIGALSAHCG
jgi:hypothetical protein